MKAYVFKHSTTGALMIVVANDPRSATFLMGQLVYAFAYWELMKEDKANEE